METPPWQQVLDASTDFYLVLDLGRRVRQYNLAFAEAARSFLNREVCPGMHLTELLSQTTPEERTFADQLWTRALKGESFSAARLVGGRAFRYVHSPWYAQDGTLLGALQHVRDLTSLVPLNRIGADPATQLHLAQHVTGLGTFVADFPGDATVDAAYRRIYGIPDDYPITLESWLALVHPADRDRVRQEVDSFSTQFESLDHEFRIVRPDGTQRWLQARTDFASLEDRIRWTGVVFDITKKKEVELDLRRQEEALLLTLEAGQMGLWTLRLSDRTVTGTATTARLFGIPAEGSMSLKECCSRIDPDDRDWVRQVFEESIRDCAEHSVECRVLAPDGRTRWISSHGRVFCDEAGNPERVTGTLMDITDRRLAEERYRQTLENTPIGVLAGDIYGGVQYVNRAFLEITGYSEQDLRDGALRWTALTPPEWLPIDAERILEAREKGACTPYEKEYIRKDGTRVPVLIGYALLGPAREESAAFILDLSERKHIENALAASEKQFRDLADSMPQLAWMAHPDGSIFWYNRRWYEYTGTTLDQMQGRGWRSVHPAHTLDAVESRYRASVASEQEFEMIFPLRGADGRYRRFLTRAIPLRDAQGRVVRWFGTNTDVEKQMQTEEALRRSNEDLQQFADVASHDLQEPLRTVAAFSQLLDLKAGDLDGDLRRFAGFAREAALRMSNLIRDLLEYSQITSESERVPENVNLNEAVHNALADLAAALNEADATVVHEPLPRVTADRSQITRVFQNLIGNALKYRRPDQPPRIAIRAERQGLFWRIDVMDNGIGFRPEFADRIFGIFKRLHREQYPGTGIGLAICKTIMERHGGEIHATGQEGAGATFSFTLPAS